MIPVALREISLDDYTRALGSILSANRSLWEGGREARERLVILMYLYRCLHQILSRFHAAEDQKTCLSPGPPMCPNGLPGRPRYNITSVEIHQCMSVELNWQGTANFLCTVGLCLGTGYILVSDIWSKHHCPTTN